MPMKNPPHPGKVVLEECIKPLGLSITEAAEGLGVTRATFGWSMAAAGFPRKWPFVCRRRSGAARKAGSVSR